MSDGFMINDANDLKKIFQSTQREYAPFIYLPITEASGLSDEEKIRKLEARNTELKQQIREMEDIDIVGMVRAMGLDPEELAKLVRHNPALITSEKEEATNNE